MVTEQASDDSDASGPRVLTHWQRTVSLAAGLAGLGAGGTATFITKNTIGAGVLLAIGAFFWLIGLTGWAPQRVKIGGNEIEWYERYQQVQKVLNRTFAEADPEAKERVAETVVESHLSPTEPVRRQAEDFLRQQTQQYERAVGSAFLRVGAQSHFIPGHDQHFNGVFRYNEIAVGVHVKYTKSNVSIKRSINEMFSILETPGWGIDVSGIVLVVPLDADYEIGDGILLGNPRLRMVRWSSPDDDDRIRATLEQLVAAAT